MIMPPAAHDPPGTPSGALQFARFAFPPNVLGLCGPETDGLLADGIRRGVAGDDLVRACRGFEGAWPYLELIAGSHGIAEPLDRRVVDAYWIGGPLLDPVRARQRHRDLEARFRARMPAKEWRWLETKVAGRSTVHHSFHVLEVLPRAGLVRGGPPPDLLGTMERCLIRPATVVGVDGDRITVRAPRLTWRGGALRLGLDGGGPDTVDASGYGDRLRVGDDVAIHWDRVCARLSEDEVARLRSTTARNLAVANETL
jgi:hypothetical protein